MSANPATWRRASVSPRTTVDSAIAVTGISVVKPSNLAEEQEELLDPDAYSELIESDEH